MISCSDVEEEMNEEADKLENSLEEMDKTFATPQALPICLKWNQIFRLPNKPR